MAKRFIDTNLFNDEWFCELSKDCKLFFIYYITTCDHAGVLRLNKKLCEFQTGLKSLETVIKELGNCLVTVKEGLYFMPKYIKFQYPNFPKSKVKQQDGAISILQNIGLWDSNLNSYISLSKELGNSYDNDNDNVIVNDNVKKEKVSKKFIPPTVEEFKSYFEENGYSTSVAERAWNGYDVANWHKSNGEAVRNWKQTCQNVWFKDENKISSQQKYDPSKPHLTKRVFN